MKSECRRSLFSFRHCRLPALAQPQTACWSDQHEIQLSQLHVARLDQDIDRVTGLR